MAAGSLTVAVPAQAETFTPQAGPPLIFPGPPPTDLQPATPQSSAIYEVTATVESPGGLVNLDQVAMCWYKGLDASSSCANAGSDPKTQFQMTWTQATDKFAVTGTNHYLDATSTSGYGDGTGTSMEMVFKFRVSDAMLAGTDWYVMLSVLDDNGQDYFRNQGTVAVNYFGAVTTQRASQDYGTLPEGFPFTDEGWVLREDLSNGAFVANGPSDLTFAATDFTGPGYPLRMAWGLPGMEVMWGEVGLECSNGPTFSLGSAVRVENPPRTIQSGLFAGGTGETPDSTLRNSCRLKYGGDASVANQPYSNTVTVGVGPTL